MTGFMTAKPTRPPLTDRRVSNDPERRNGYAGLDLVRFAAALSVTLYHLAYWDWLPARGAAAAQPVTPITPVPAFAWGWAGVPLFFVLSGFVIAFSAEGRSAGSFVISRITRLYPGAWICATIALLVLRDAALVPAYLRSMVLSPVGPWIDGVYWTLAIEMVFYALVAVTLLTGFASLRTLGVALGTYSALFWAATTADMVTGHHLAPLFTAVEGYTGYLLLLHAGCYFALGIMLWKQTRAPWTRFEAMMTGVFFLAGLISIAAKAHAIGSSLVMAPLAWTVAVGLIAASVRFERRRPVPARWIRGFRTVGLATYPLYLLHNSLGSHAMLWSGLRGGTAIAFGVAIALIASFLAVGLEAYPRALLRGVLGSASRRPPAADLP